MLGGGRVLRQQAGAAQIDPQRTPDFHHQLGVLLDFGGAARAGDDGGHGGVRRAELQGGGFDVGAVAPAEAADGLGARHHVGFRRLIVEGRAASQKPGIVGTASTIFTPLARQAGNSCPSAVWSEQGVAPGDQEEVGLRRLGRRRKASAGATRLSPMPQA